MHPLVLLADDMSLYLKPRLRFGGPVRERIAICAQLLGEVPT